MSTALAGVRSVLTFSMVRYPGIRNSHVFPINPRSSASAPFSTGALSLGSTPVRRLRTPYARNMVVLRSVLVTSVAVGGAVLSLHSHSLLVLFLGENEVATAFS